MRPLLCWYQNQTSQENYKPLSFMNLHKNLQKILATKSRNIQKELHITTESNLSYECKKFNIKNRCDTSYYWRTKNICRSHRFKKKAKNTLKVKKTVRELFIFKMNLHYTKEVPLYNNFPKETWHDRDMDIYTDKLDDFSGTCLQVHLHYSVGSMM